MKTAVSIPDPIFEAAERLAGRAGISRSKLYATALKAYIEAHRGVGVREALDSVYGTEASGVDPALAAMQAATLGPEKW